MKNTKIWANESIKEQAHTHTYTHTHTHTHTHILQLCCCIQYHLRTCTAPVQEYPVPKKKKKKRNHTIFFFTSSEVAWPSDSMYIIHLILCTRIMTTQVPLCWQSTTVPQSLNCVSLSFIYWLNIKQWRMGRNRSTRRKPLVTSFRKFHILKLKDSSPKRDSNLHNSIGGRLGKQTC